MSEVSAVVLTVGEPFAERAIRSLATQSVPLHEQVVIAHVSPFSRAINEGARRVSTPYFVQVDADMILDPTCVEVLLRHMRPGIGIVAGELRDPLVGQVVGIRMFRTACFRDGGMPDSISPDTDFGERLTREGWCTLHVENPGAGPGTTRPTVGVHQPDYTPSYTHRKFLLEGARVRYRAASYGLMFLMDALDHSTHPLSLLARVAYLHGLFVPMAHDELKAPRHDQAAEALAALLAGPGRADELVAEVLPFTQYARLGEIFRRFVAVGAELGDAAAGETFREAFKRLCAPRADRRALVARIALAHGLLMPREDHARLSQDERALRDFIVFNLGSRATTWDRVRARTRPALSPRGERASASW